MTVAYLILGTYPVPVIQDNRDMQYYLHQMLAGSYRVELAGDGDVGLHCARDEIPDLIICDVMLPERDGYQVVNELKSDSSGPATYLSLC